MRYRPWYCGTQHADWEYRNCNRCSRVDYDARRNDCELYDAVSEAFWGDGTVSEDAARRLGYLVDGQEINLHNWDCPERQTREGDE